jgi:N-hydroxyarylamine O-acetyltransferase
VSTTSFSLDAYCARIGYAGPLRPTVEVLDAVQQAQLEAIPFENFDILLGRGISLDPDPLCRKLLHARRGGYCFELNAVFLMALGSIGFEARSLLARVHMRGEPSGRVHQLILLTVDGRPWIADTGFGGPGLRAPIPLEPDVERTQLGECCRLVDAGPFGTMLQRHLDGGWRDLYSFDLGHVGPADIALGNHFTSTHPSSFFTFSRVAARQTPGGRVALLDLTLRRVEQGVETVEELPDGAAFLDAVASAFGIELDAPYAAMWPVSPATSHA